MDCDGTAGDIIARCYPVVAFSTVESNKLEVLKAIFDVHKGSQCCHEGRCTSPPVLFVNSLVGGKEADHERFIF